MNIIKSGINLDVVGRRYLGRRAQLQHRLYAIATDRTTDGSPLFDPSIFKRAVE